MSEPEAEPEITVDELDPTTISVVGDIDYDTVAPLRATVDRVLAAAPSAIVFDLGGVGFMDSSGLAVLIEASNRGAEVRVRSATSAVRLTIRATGLEHLLETDR
jgi:anti-anti-sigma factor